ncbi:flavin reductase [Cupriavidus sp. 2TAF22]|uniref:flavin reductase n=1 Tax=unclassified Cupriavidus TaxID=2640874 RepID=UPI003F8F85FC
MPGFPFAAHDTAHDQTPDAHPGITAQAFREALAKAVTPVTVIATDGAAGVAGVTCSAVCSVCDNPPTVLVCINRKSYANAVIKTNGVLSVNWLQSAQSAVSQVFAGAGALPMPERFANGDWGTLQTGAPCSQAASVTLDCRVAESYEVGSHSIFIAHVLAASHADAVSPLVYCQRAYATTQPVAA